MPKEYDGLPIHPLVVHAVVILIPLAALVAVLFLVPRFRTMARWPMLILTVAALVSTYIARLSGKNLEDNLQYGGKTGELIDRHQELANQLWYVMIGFAIVVGIAAYVLRPIDMAEASHRGGSADDGDQGATTLDTVVRRAVATLVVVGAVAAGVQTYRTGEHGARAVWNPEGTVDYGAGQADRAEPTE